jgi:hypothetical protein
MTSDKPDLMTATPAVRAEIAARAYELRAKAALKFCMGVPLPDDVTLRRVLGMLSRCEAKFRLYEKMHQDKGTSEGFRKAETNGAMADSCKKILDRFGGDNDQR